MMTVSVTIHDVVVIVVNLLLLVLFLREYTSTANNSDIGYDFDDIDGMETSATVEVGWPIFVLGLPRSGSEIIHNYFTSDDIMRRTRKNEYSISSSHYCCRNPKSKKKATSQQHTQPQSIPTKFPCIVNWDDDDDNDETGDNDDNSKEFIPCGECILNQLQQHLPPSDQTSSSLSLSSSSLDVHTIFEQHINPNCGISSNDNQNHHHVWSSFHVEINDPYFGYFLPQHYMLSLLHVAYPNATWILNTRGKSPTQSKRHRSNNNDKQNDSHNDNQGALLWSKSIMHWKSITERILNSFHVPLFSEEIERRYQHQAQLSTRKPVANEKVPKQEVMDDLQVQLYRQGYMDDNNKKKDNSNTTTTTLSFFKEQYQYKLSKLQEIYINHTKLIESWITSFPKTHKFIRIHVDDDISTIYKQLDYHIFGIIHPTTSSAADTDNSAAAGANNAIDTTTTTSTIIQQLDHDWKDFSLPF